MHAARSDNEGAFPESTRTCNQTAMSGWIRIGFIDLPALSLENPSYEADSGACETGAVLRALCVSMVQGGSLLTASQQARQAHNLKVIGSNPIPATK
jgi:hypothetical protein